MVMKKLGFAVAACACVLGGAGTLDGGQPLSLKVSPAMAAAPAFIRVSAIVEANDDNRSLEIVAQSPQFFRSSTIDLDGRNSPPLTVIEYPNLPPGFYEVSAVLVGTTGKRATAMRFVKVVPTAGSY
jgi:hypothetical protein